MKRKYLKDLQVWIEGSQCKPLVIRGARQVGKTWLVRHFAEVQNLRLIELNFEKRPELASFFETNDPKEILLNLESAFNVKIEPSKSLLFLDEIQAVPELFAKLRWFAEDLPQLPVIAAGSLLEFVLEKHTFSMPVGRINYLYMEPLSFEEFLLANDKHSLVDYIEGFRWGTQIPEALHLQLMQIFKEYLFIGGMPEAVASWATERSLTKISQIHQDLLGTYRDDFAKYSGRMDTARLEDAMAAVPRLLGEKFVYSKVNPHLQSYSVKQALDLLCKAKICHKVKSCHANGIPLGSEIDEKFFKVIFIDVGLCNAALGLTFNQINSVDEVVLINKGAIAEQAVGQLLRTIDPSYIPPDLYYWVREEKIASAEIDYLIQRGADLVPVEVKAGRTGTLKSLHIFIGLKNLKFGIRINSNFPNFSHVQTKNSFGILVKYSLLSLPFYLVGQIQRLMDEQ